MRHMHFNDLYDPAAVADPDDNCPVADILRSQGRVRKPTPQFLGTCRCGNPLGAHYLTLDGRPGCHEADSNGFYQCGCDVYRMT